MIDVPKHKLRSGEKLLHVFPDEQNECLDCGVRLRSNRSWLCPTCERADVQFDEDLSHELEEAQS